MERTVATVTIADSDLDIDGKGTRQRLPGALVRLRRHILGRLAGWFAGRLVRYSVARYELKIAELQDRLEVQQLNHDVERRKQAATIDALTAEKNAMAELVVNITNATKFSALQYQRGIDHLKSPREE